MAEVRNLGNAAVIVACIYFLIAGGLGIWAKIGLFVLLLFALATWGVPTGANKAIEHLEMKIRSEKEKAINFRAGTNQLLIQTKLLQKGL